MSDQPLTPPTTAPASGTVTLVLATFLFAALRLIRAQRQAYLDRMKRLMRRKLDG